MSAEGLGLFWTRPCSGFYDAQTFLVFSKRTISGVEVLDSSLLKCIQDSMILIDLNAELNAFLPRMPAPQILKKGEVYFSALPTEFRM